MHRILLSIALLLPALAHASCDIVRDGKGLNVVVGGGSESCLSDPAFREAFVGRLNQALAEEEAVREARVRALTATQGAPRKPGQATAGGRYYGQRP